MRIPVKAPYKGYVPTLDLSTNELVWVKTKRKDVGIPIGFIEGFFSLATIIGLLWAINIQAFNAYPGEITVYQALGPAKFISFFIIAFIAGLLCYLYALFMYNFKKIRKTNSEESIIQYKRASYLSKNNNIVKQDTKIKLKPAIWICVFLTPILPLPLFLGDINHGGSVLPGMLLGMLLVITTSATYATLYYTTAYYARKYLDKKFNIKPKKK